MRRDLKATLQSILLSIQEFDELGRAQFLERYSYPESKRYFISFNRRRYDAKPIVGVASKFAKPDAKPIPSSHFYETSDLKSYLEAMGFAVLESGAAAGLAAWVEVERREHEPDEAWKFGKCLWSPTRTRNDYTHWPWSALPYVCQGDLVLHLGQKAERYYLIGASVATSECYETRRTVPDPGLHGNPRRCYRVDLSSLVSFDAKRSIRQVLQSKSSELMHIQTNHKSKLPLFFTGVAAGLKLRPGTYLSIANSELLKILMHSVSPGNPTEIATILDHSITAVEVSVKATQVLARGGQTKFSRLVRDNYAHACCFPGCSVADGNFLVASHIDRWADNEERRGNLNNGLCLCLLHDKAFELGYFTLSAELIVICNDDKGRWQGVEAKGQPLRLGTIRPSQEALAAHWSRHGYGASVGK